jgi:hypothetical protein
MSDPVRATRRQLLRSVIALPVIAALPTALSACGGGVPRCTDESSLSSADRDARRGARYEERASDPARACSGCTFFTSAGAEACGSCSVVRGPINPGGTCTLFAART